MLQNKAIWTSFPSRPCYSFKED